MAPGAGGSGRDQRGGTDQPSGPTGPADSRPGSPGLDWHTWWGGARLRYWPQRSEGATAGGAGDALPGRAESATAWIRAIEGLLDAQAQWPDRMALAEGLAYLPDRGLLPIATRLARDRHDEVSRMGIFASGAAMGDDPTAVAVLLGVLLDPRRPDRARGAAGASLGATGDPAARPILLRVAGSRAEDTIRSGALVGLGSCGLAPDVAQVARILHDGHERVPIRTAAVIALGMLARASDVRTRTAATRALVEAARRPNRFNVETRQTLALNLAHGEPSRALVDAITELCHDDGDERTRGLAAIALGRLARRAPEWQPWVRTALRARWTREPQAVKSFFALAFGIGRIASARRDLEDWLERGGDPIHRGAAAIGLGLLGDPAALPALQRAAEGGAVQLRGDATEALGHLGGAAAAAYLRRQLGRRDCPAAVHGAAAYALGVIGERGDLDAMAAMLRAPNPDVRIGAVIGLGAFGGAAARDALLRQAVAEGNPTVRALACLCAPLAMATRPLQAPAKDLDRSPWARDH